jgi:hypothetical protein
LAEASSRGFKHTQERLIMSRCIFRIELTHSARKSLHAVTEKLGMTQVAVTSKMIEWFALQDDAIQKAVLGLFPDKFDGDIAAMILARMAGPKQPGKNHNHNHNHNSSDGRRRSAKANT